MVSAKSVPLTGLTPVLPDPLHKFAESTNSITFRAYESIVLDSPHTPFKIGLEIKKSVLGIFRLFLKCLGTI